MERLQSKRFWLGGGAVAALLIVAIGWFMFIGPEMSSTADLNGQQTATEQQNAQLQTKVSSLQKKGTQLTRYTASLKAALSALPFDSGLPAFTRQLSAQAKANDVVIGSIAVGGVTAVAAATTATPTASTTDSTATTTTTATPATTVAGSLFAVQVTVQSTGTFDGQLAFINDIRTAGVRRALITSTQVAPGVGAGTGSIDAAAAITTQLTIFSEPQSPAQIAVLNKLLASKIGN